MANSGNGYGYGFFNKSIKGCCYDCPDRYPACHDSCETYKQAKQEWDEAQSQIRKERERLRAIDHYHYRAVQQQRQIKRNKEKK